jgi:O-antigen/teichoic acid export membrane protein
LNIQYIQKILSYSIKTHLNNIVSFLNYRVDNLILALFSGATFVGLYSVSVGLSERLWIISTAIGAVIFARISTLEEGDLRRERITPITTRFVLWSSIIIALVAAPILIVLIPILYSKAYLGSIIPLLILLPGTVTYNVGRVLANDIAGRGKPEINLIQSMIALIVNILTNLLLIPRLNAYGAAVASTVSYSLWAVLTLRVYLRLSKVPLRETIVPIKSDFLLLRTYLISTYGGLKKLLLKTKAGGE